MTRALRVGAIVVAIVVGIVMIVVLTRSDDDEPESTSDTSLPFDPTEPVPGGEADGGTIDEPADLVDGGENDPVPIDEVADFGGGVTARVQRVESTDADANLPGERSGPAVIVTLELSNRSGAPIDLDAVTVDLIQSTGESATSIVDPDHEGFVGTLDSGDTAAGSFLFRIDEGAREDVTITMKYAATAPRVVFVGDLDDV